MTDVLLPATRWLTHMALGGSLLLGLTWLLLLRVRQPARRQRLAEWGVLAAVSLAGLALLPSWFFIPVPTSEAPQDPTPLAAREEQPALPIRPIESAPFALQLEPPPSAELFVPESDTPTADAPILESSARWPTLAGLLSLLLLGYFVGVALFLARLVGGSLWLRARIARAERASPRLLDLLDDLLAGQVPPRVLVSHEIAVPLSFGLIQPTIILPADFCRHADTIRLRWVLSHELAHLRRRDGLSCWLFALASMLYYFVPWYWRVRREARLCQEHVADAAAVAQTGPAVDYADFLLAWVAVPNPPLLATGVSGQSSDLFWRISMLVKNSMDVEQRCPRRWSWLAGSALLALAVLAGGVGLRATASPLDDPEDQPKKKADQEKDPPKPAVDPTKDKKEPGDPEFPEFEELLKRFPSDLPPDQLQMMKQQLEQARRMADQMRRNMRGGPGLPFGELPRMPAFPGGDMGFGRPSEPRLGVQVEKLSDTIVEQLDLPRNQGLIVQEVLPDTPAAKAGLKKHDILLELDGKAVPTDPRKFIGLLGEIKPDTKIDLVVLRKSRKETLKGITLPKPKDTRPQDFELPRVPFNTGPVPGRFGQGGGRINLGAGVGAFGGGQGWQLNRQNDDFTASHQNGELEVSVKGSLSDGKAKVGEIKVKVGKKTSTFESVDKVPEEHQATVRKLINMAETGKVEVRSAHD